MSHFLYHEACPRCGSRDNLARYSDGGGYCFGCKYYERGIKLPWEQVDESTGDSSDGGAQAAYEAATRTIGEDGLHWLSHYEMGPKDAILHLWKWNPKTRELLFPLWDKEGKLVCLQAKNFDPERKSKAKYFNRGDKERHWTIYENFLLTGTLVLTEDIVSAAKVSSVSDAMPLLGVSIRKEKLVEISREYDKLVVWLDRDKWKEARMIAEQAKMLGMNASTILTDKDPKEYSNEEIMVFLENK